MASPTLPADIAQAPSSYRGGVRAAFIQAPWAGLAPLPRLLIAESMAGLSNPLEHKQGPGLGQDWAEAKVIRPQLPSEITVWGTVQEGFLDLLACSPGLGYIPVGRGRSGSSQEARQAAMRPPAQPARSSRCFLLQVPGPSLREEELLRLPEEAVQGKLRWEPAWLECQR